MRAFTASVVCLAALGVRTARAESASDLIEAARSQGGFDRSTAYRVTTGDDCQPQIEQAGQALDSLEFVSGDSVVLELCTSGGEHYFEADELFQNSAFRKAETATGYVKGDIFSACEVFPNADNSCCAMFFIPMAEGTYEARDKRCEGGVGQGVIPVTVTGQSGTTLEQDTDPTWTAPTLQDDAGNDASSSDWAGWEDPLYIEITLVEDPSCGQSAGRRLQQEGDATPSSLQEGDADAGDATSYMWVYTGGFSEQSTPLVKGRDDVEREEGQDGETNTEVQEASKSEQGTATINAVSAQEHPIEMVVGQGYVLTVSLLRPSTDHYFSAAAFFRSAIVRKLQDNIAEMKFQTYPTDVELFDDRGSMEIYVAPTVVGEFDFSRSDDADDSAAAATAGKIRVVASTSELSDPSTFQTQPIYQGTC